MDIFGMAAMEDQMMMNDAMMQQQAMNNEMAMAQTQMMQMNAMQQMDMAGQMAQMGQTMMAMAPAYTYDRYGMPKMNKQQCLEQLKNYVFMCTQKMVVNVIKIPEVPDVLRHACVDCGISNLPKNNFCIQEIGFQMEFFFCKGCGNLYIPQDIMWI